jgi:thiosulfate/3-mercaptopyruvate sulfurtransferase
VWRGDSSDDARMNVAPPQLPLITALELAACLGDSDLLIVDCRFDLKDPAWGRRQYMGGHIPDAIYAHLEEDLSGPKRPDSGRHPLPTPECFAQTLSSWGLRAGTRVVTYDQGNGAQAARLWWMLRSRGHGAVQVLDGGFAAWCSAGLATDTQVAVPVPQKVESRAFAGVVDTAEVVSGLARQSISLVDARAADRFAGRNETIDPVAGHIPGAINFAFTKNLEPDGQFLPAALLMQHWRAILDKGAGKDLVAMCGSGVTACHNLLALEIIGQHGGKLYAGSFSEWIRNPARPVQGDI